MQPRRESSVMTQRPDLVLPETRIVHSVERMLSTEEAESISALIGQSLEDRRAEFAVGRRTRSVHEIEGESLDTVVETYEPNGRLEFDELPDEVVRQLDAAVTRCLPDIRVAYPSASGVQGWFYVEYTAGQHVTPHIDYPIDEDRPAELKYAAISITLRSAKSGGEFFVETFAHPEVWQNGRVQYGGDMHVKWFREMSRTRWRVVPRLGDAIMWGTQMIHGTEPVRDGTAAKLVGLLS